MAMDFILPLFAALSVSTVQKIRQISAQSAHTPLVEPPQAETAANGPPAVRGGEVPAATRRSFRKQVITGGGSWELGVAEEALVGPVDGIARADGQLRREHLDVGARPAELAHERVPERRVSLITENLL